MRKKTTESFKQEVFEQVGNEYTVMEEYQNNYTNIRIKHETCGHIWSIKPYNFLRGRRCSKCAGKMKKNTKQFKTEVFEQVGNEYRVLGEYQNNHAKIQMKHETCGHIWEITPAHFLNNSNRCPKCAGVMKKNTEQFKAEVFQQVGDEYTVMGEYQNSYTKIRIKHNDCGHVWSVAPYSFLSNGVRCPKCKSSKMEKYVNEWLTKQGCVFMPQWKMPGSQLSFDFAVLDSQGSVQWLIECQGQHHYEPVRFGGRSQAEAEKAFEIQKEHDFQKREYCYKNGISLTEIPYTLKIA
jgi:hypothetical protein